MTSQNIPKIDCSECGASGLVSAAWDILPPGDAPAMDDCPVCDGSGKVDASTLS